MNSGLKFEAAVSLIGEVHDSLQGVLHGRINVTG